MRRMLRAWAVVLVVGAASAGLLAAPAAAVAVAVVPSDVVQADVQDFSFDSVDVDYTLGRSEEGTPTLRVVETFVAVFPETDQNRGMQRRIPERFLGVPTHPELISVTDGDGAPRPVETDNDDDHLIVTSRASDYLHGAQTFVFTYDMDNVVRYYSDTGVQEFYWDVNGVDWAQPFGSVSARVRMPADIADGLTGASACYQGEQDSTATCEISDATTDGADTVISARAVDLAPYETMTVSIAFTDGTFTLFDRSFLATGWGWVQAVAAVVGLGGLGAAIATRRRWLRDEPGRPTVIAEYDPPRDVDALESAVLLLKPTKAIPAEVLEQAVAGSIRIVEGQKSFWGSGGYDLQLVDPSRADNDGIALLQGIFGPDLSRPERDTFSLGKADSRLSTTTQKILKAADVSLVQKGLRRTVPAGRRALPILLTILAAVAVGVTGIIAMFSGTHPLVPILLIITSVAVIFVASGLVVRKPLTARGAEVRDHLAGLKEFIEWAEADRIRMLQSPTGAEREAVSVNDPRQIVKLYERLLPFAVVFGQEKEWAKQLVVYYGDEQPGWYFGTGVFNAAAFSSSISSLSSSTSASASTSGGSSGGGSAGGGGGGGGGGGV